MLLVFDISPVRKVSLCAFSLVRKRLNFAQELRTAITKDPNIHTKSPTRVQNPCFHRILSRAILGPDFVRSSSLQVLDRELRLQRARTNQIPSPNRRQKLSHPSHLWFRLLCRVVFLDPANSLVGTFSIEQRKKWRIRPRPGDKESLPVRIGCTGRSDLGRPTVERDKQEVTRGGYASREEGKRGRSIVFHISRCAFPVSNLSSDSLESSRELCTADRC